MGLGDRRLVRRMLRGNERAFEEFFDACFPGLYRFALTRMGHDADAAEDVAQATLCAAIAKLGTYRGEATLFTWLCTFCRHEISAFYRRRHRQPPTVGLIEENVDVRAALESLSMYAGNEAQESLRRKEVARLVHLTLDHLPSRYAKALEWKYAEDLSVKQIAMRLDTSAKAAESLLTRAREAFRDGFSSLTRSGSPMAASLVRR